ncbi:lectin-like domain-containing protein [Actinomycetota bacterium Odt1-20B]
MTDTRQARGRRAGLLRSRLAAPLGLVTAAAIGLTMATSLTSATAVARGDYDHEEKFNGTSIDASQWYSSAGSKGTGYACLTAATGQKGPLKACPGGTPDRDGHGALRLTSNDLNQNGFVVSRNPFPADRGLELTLDYASYDSKGGPGADGIAVMLLDGGVPLPKGAGAYGAGLGYNGIKGGYLGVGIDNYGNFLKNQDGFPGQAKRKANSVTVRGTTEQSNQVVDTYPSDRSLDAPKAKDRNSAVRSVRVRLSTAGRLSVAVDFHDKQGFQNKIDNFDLNNVPGQPKLPKNLRFGLAASTGASVEYHDVWNLRAATLPDRLTSTVDPAGPITADRRTSFDLKAGNDPAAGPTDGPRTSRAEFPQGITPTDASGDGWKCKVNGQAVTCTNPGTGKNELGPGKQWPPVHIKTKIKPGTKGEQKITSNVTGPDGKPGPTMETTVRVNLDEKPSVTAVMTNDARLRAGDNAAWTIKTKNDAKATGATNGPVTVTRTFPEGVEIVSADGPNWRCKIAKQAVTCTRPGTGADIANPGDSFPDIHIGAIVPKTYKGHEMKVPGSVETPNNRAKNTKTNEILPVGRAAVEEPNLAVNVTPVGAQAEKQPGKAKIAVDNDKNAGPTHGTVTVSRDFGDGVTPTAASGDGWKCTVNGQNVRCTRPGTGKDALEPGKAYPPITVETKNGPAATVPGETKVTTQGSDRNEQVVRDTTVVVKDPKADAACGAYIKNRALCAQRSQPAVG